MASFLSIPFPGRYSKKIDIPDYKICLIDGGIIGEYYLEYENKMLIGDYPMKRLILIKYMALIVARDREASPEFRIIINE
jgi:hypothetical protein